MRAQVQFKEKFAYLESPSSTLENAINEILECETLIQLLLVILTTGNIINGVSSPSPPLPFLSTLSIKLNTCYCSLTRGPLLVMLMVSKLSHFNG